MSWIGRLAMLCKFLARQDGESRACDDQGNTRKNEGWREGPAGEREMHCQLKGNRSKEWNAKDHFEYLPPTLVRDIC